MTSLDQKSYEGHPRVHLTVMNHPTLHTAPWGYCIIKVELGGLVSFLSERNPYTLAKQRGEESHIDVGTAVVVRGWRFPEGVTPTEKLLDCMDALDRALCEVKDR